MSIVEPGATGAGLIARVKGILLRPSATWDEIEREPATPGSLFTGYVLPLAAIPQVCTLIGGLVFGYGAFGVVVKPSIPFALTQAILGYVLGLAMVFVLTLVIENLAPTFGGQKDRIQAMKVAAYAPTASWVSGIFGLLPALTFVMLIGAIYSLVILYKGLPRLMKNDAGRTTPYFITILVVGLVAGIICALAMNVVTGLTGGMQAATSQVSGTVKVPGVGSVDMAELEKASKQVEAAAKQMENGQAAPATDPEALKGILPASVAGYARSDLSGSSSAAGGLNASSAEATYSKGSATIKLTVGDMGAAGALAGLANAIDVSHSKDTSTGYEKIGKVNGRMTQEKYDRQSRHGEYSVLVGERFMVQAEGQGATMDELKAAVDAVPTARLEGLAKAG